LTLLLLFPASGAAATGNIIARVERLLHARLVEAGGLRVDHFSDDTNPTRTVVLGFINDFASLVYMRTGELDGLTCTRADAIRVAAEVLIAQRVAIEIEWAYWPEEVVESAAGSAQARSDRLDADLLQLVTMVEGCRAADGDDGGGSTSRSDPAWLFPVQYRIRY
jgi:hypothetical protein